MDAQSEAWGLFPRRWLCSFHRLRGVTPWSTGLEAHGAFVSESVCCFGVSGYLCAWVFQSDVALYTHNANLGRSRDWHEGALAAAKAEGLREKLGRVCASHECQGKISPFFSNKFGLSPE